MARFKAGNEFLQTYKVEFAIGDFHANTERANGSSICEWAGKVKVRPKVRCYGCPDFLRNGSVEEVSAKCTL